jgi:outer membrane protein assembly factor BamB
VKTNARSIPPFALLCGILLWALPAPPMVADNWPQWRGPESDGTSSESGLPLDWGTDRNIAWRLPLPERGAATPIVWGERIFLTVGEDPRQSNALWLWSIDRASGEVQWKGALGGGNEQKHKQFLSSPSPVTDGESVWALTGTGILKAFTFDGRQKWARDLQSEYGPFGLQWGYASSPLLYGDSLYVQVLHGMNTDDPSYLLRVDKESGKTLWKVERPTAAAHESPDAYTTPQVYELAGGTEGSSDSRAVIVISGGDVLTGHDAATGSELWRVGGLNPGRSGSQRLVASPIVNAEMIYAFGKRSPILAFRPGADGAPTLAWQSKDGTDVPTPVTDGRLLYVVNDKGIMWCRDALTGDLVWGPERLTVETYSASPVLADGKVYATSEGGVTTVVKASREFEVLARNELEGFTLASPAISDGQIFLRTAEYLYAIGERR